MVCAGVSNPVEREKLRMQEGGELLEQCLKWTRGVGIDCMFEGAGLS